MGLVSHDAAKELLERLEAPPNAFNKELLCRAARSMKTQAFDVKRLGVNHIEASRATSSAIATAGALKDGRHILNSTFRLPARPCDASQHAR